MFLIISNVVYFFLFQGGTSNEDRADGSKDPGRQKIRSENPFSERIKMASFVIEKLDSDEQYLHGVNFN